MAKKITAKERREQKLIKNKEKGAQVALQQKEKERLAAEAEKESNKKNADKENDILKKSRKKSSVKANGLKSVFVMENKALMTSFGKGNKANPEKELVGGEIRELTDSPVFDASNLGNIIEISRRGVRIEKKGYIASDYEIHKDVINAKDKLEERYFGSAMDDNIHIQMVYQVLDIEKILSVYIDNIIYSLRNVLTSNEGSSDDLIGNMGGKEYEKYKEGKDYDAFHKLYENEKLRYFGSAFYDSGYDIKASKTVKDNDGKKKERSNKRSEEDIYYILSLLGSVRQFIKHGRNRGKDRTWLYSLDREGILKEAEKNILDRLYGGRMENLNRNFIKTSDKDLTVAIQALKREGINEKKVLVRDYYDFVVLKKARNMGFSIKKLRERMIDSHMQDLRSDSCNSYRSKLYRLIDFIIYTFYSSTDEGSIAAGRIIEDLRSSFNDSEKEELYVRHGDHLWERCRDSIETAKRGIVRITKKDFTVDPDLKEIRLDDHDNLSENTTYFSKLMFMMTLFLDGKEINDLLTSLINKFDNIQSFEDILNANGLKSFKEGKKLEYDYTFLSDSARLADELRIVKSVSRMEMPMPAAKTLMFEDALKLFWIDSPEEAKKIISGDNKKIRNFIANNVVESSWFNYIVRYTDLKNARDFIRCRPIVEFVLNKVPETQIDRYWKTCGCETNSIVTKGKKGKVKDITDKMMGLDSSVFTKGNIENGDEKNIKKALVNLYLLIIYQVIKGLIFVNSKYTIAIHSLERDAVQVLKLEGIFDKKEGHNYDGLFAMTDRYISERENELEVRKRDNKRARYHVLNMIKKSREAIGDLNDENIRSAYYHMCKLYRNSIAHLNAVTEAHKYIGKFSENYRVTSYFALYHFFMQEYLMNHKDFTNSDFHILESKVKEWSEDVEKYRGFNKNWLWSLNVPFAYNPSRYKSLSMEHIFYEDPDAVVEI